MTRWLTASLREGPATVPALAALALFVVWATSQAGYPLTHWAPGGLIVLVLLAIALLAVPLRLAEIPLPVKLALGCLAAYTVLSFLSILWAQVPGDAWEGANRSLLYLLVFSLFALWRGRGTSAALLVGFWTLAMIGLAVYVAVRLDTVSAASFESMFVGERLGYPSGYPNATAAQWLMAFWPALLLARGPRLHWGLRGLLAGGAVVLADVALLSQSRGSLYAMPVMLVLVFAFVPQRLRTFATSVPVVLGIGVTAPLLLRVGDRIQSSQDPLAAVHTGLLAMFACALVVGLLVAAGAAIESSGVVSPRLAKGVSRGLAAVALATLVAILVGGLAVAGRGVGGNPITRVRHAWESFKGGYSSDASSGSRLVSGLGSNRYDFYRVALDEFVAHPVLGIGADNFSQQYLAHGRSQETPRYPHSVELRTLTETGALGGLLAAVGLGAALLAAWLAMRRSDPLVRTVAAAALGGFAYWGVHGSFDWFWEFAGLGAPAFALLGVACSLTPRTPLAWSAHTRRRSVARRWSVLAIGVVVALAIVLSLTAPWLSEREIQSAAHIWPKAPLTAYARLSGAARLNPLSDEAYLVAGSIALRYGDVTRGAREFRRALERVPNDAYATLELGAIASESGEHTRSLALLDQVARLNPRDPITQEALRIVRSGKRLSVARLNRSILLNAEHLS